MQRQTFKRQIMKLRTTNRLFLGKWAHKIVFQFAGARWVSSYAEYILGSEPLIDDFLAEESQDDMSQFVRTSWDFLKKAQHTRFGGNRIYMYFNDPANLANMPEDTKRFVHEVWAPKNKQHLDYILANCNKIICKKLPKNKYRYKITLKSSMSKANRQIFIEWANKYSNDNIHLTRSTDAWMRGEKYYLPIPYFYVSDQSMVTMSCMILGQSVGKIEEFTVKSEI
jgi:hypothetical protein